MDKQIQKRGGGFLLAPTEPEDIVTPEDFTEEQLLMHKTAAQFIEKEVVPVMDEIEEQRFEHTIRLLKEAGQLGLLAAEVPERYGGLQLDMISSSLITEGMSRGRSFALSYGAHIGIGTLPLVYFGTEQQKETFLPDLATGQKLAAYALTEATSGSDALSAKTIATLSECGNYYILTGEKQWITNSAFADLFVVYGKVEGEHFTAFLVEREREGVSTGKEEQKMGIKGSSTRSLILDGVKVPKEHVLGEVGRGHIIAFNILNMGRYKLAVACVGSCKRAIQLSLSYAQERKQFKQAIIHFPLIQTKIAEMAIQTYVTESMVYRTSGLLEAAFSSLTEQDWLDHKKVASVVGEYAVECSINKIFASEALDQVIDEAVQIHGGYGFMSEYEVENIYRDSRINRIFEGTNEINRLLIPSTLLRKAFKNELPLFEAAQGLEEELIMYIPQEREDQLLDREKEIVERAKKLLLLTAGTVIQTYQTSLEKEQVLLSHLADMVILIYATESAVLRTEKALKQRGIEREKLKYGYVQVFAREALEKLEKLSREALSATLEGDELRTLLSVIRKLTRQHPTNILAHKREIAAALIGQGNYTT